MALLTGPEIARLVALGEMKIVPFDPDNLNPNSYNLRISDQLLVYEKMKPLHDFLARRENGRRYPMFDPDSYGALPVPVPMDMSVEEKCVPMTIPADGMVLWPGIVYLGATVEYTETPKHAPKIDGRSSVGRLGMMIHVTAGFGDVNFCGDWTLELVVTYPLRVFPNVPVCQIAYSTVEGEHMPYKGQYQGQRGPKPSGLWKSLRKKE